MKKLGSLVVLSLAAIVAVLFIGANSAMATSPFAISLTNNTTNEATNNTVTTTNNDVDTNVLNNNVVATNNINDNVVVKNKISETGEFDTYIISGVAIATLLVGTVAFVKSRKLN